MGEQRRVKSYSYYPCAVRKRSDQAQSVGPLEWSASIAHGERLAHQRLSCRWMLADGTERSAQVKEFRAIQMQRLYCRSACRSTPHDDHEVLAPGKVSCPALAARVKERNDTPCLRVRGVGFGIFVTVAPRTRPCQILQGRLAASLTGSDVFTVKGRVGEMRRTATVFAQFSRPRAYLTAHSSWNVLTRHRRHFASPVLP